MTAAKRSSSSRWLALAAGAGVLATLSGCVVAPLGPHRAYAQPVYSEPVYVGPPAAVIVQPAPPRYYGGGWRYRNWR